MKKSLSINIFFYIFLYLASATLFIDYLTYFTQLPYILDLILGLLIFGVLFYKGRHYIKIENSFEKNDVFFFVFLFLLMALTIVFPDKMYDTNNYHLYNQLFPFANKISMDFFPSRFIQSFSYAYPDRLFYLCRYILGYRLGLLLNYLILLILYYQVKKIFSQEFKIQGLFKFIFSTLVVLSLSIIDMMDTYYIDLISLVFLFEIFSQVMYGPALNENKRENSKIVCYLGLLSGLCFATKISNMFFIIVLAFVYIIKNFRKLKNLNLGHYLLFLLCFLLPCILYICYTWIQTGNPVFPFYNNIFHSEYYPNEIWMDTLFGPSRWLEVFFWPILILKYPNRAINISVVEPIWSFGYVVSFFYIGYWLIKKIKKEEYNNKKFYLAVVCILINIVWSKFVLGYVRYGLFVLVLNNMMTFIFFYDSLKNKRILATSLMFILLFWNYGYCYQNYIGISDFWSYNNFYAYGKDSYIYNLKKLFSREGEKINFPSNSAWGIADTGSGFMKLLNNKIPMIYLQPSDLSKVNKQRDKLLSKIDHVYIAFDYLSFSDFLKYLNYYGWTIMSCYDIVQPDYLNYNNYIYIFEIEKSTENNNHYIETSKFIPDLPENTQKISFYYGLSGSMHNVSMEGYKLQVVYRDQILEETTLVTNDHNLNYFEYEFCDSFASSDDFYIRVVKNNMELDYIKFVILNDDYKLGVGDE